MIPGGHIAGLPKSAEADMTGIRCNAAGSVSRVPLLLVGSTCDFPVSFLSCEDSSKQAQPGRLKFHRAGSPNIRIYRPNSRELRMLKALRW